MILPYQTALHLDHDDMFHVYYNERENKFYDEGGYRNDMMFYIMTPNEMHLFKLNKEDMIIRTRQGDLYEVAYCTYEDEEEC